MPAGVALDAMSAWRYLLPSWPWVIGIAALLRALGSPAALLHDPDTYLHIAAGRWMLAQWALPATDPFSYTFAGTHWVSSEWLGEVALAAAYGYAGWGGVIVLTAAGFAAAIGLLTRFLLRRLDPLSALIAALAGATLLLPHLLARPHVLALPFLVAWCGALLGARDDQRAPPWAVLPVMVVWANLHGSFMLGLALAAFAASEALWQRRKEPAGLAAVGHWIAFFVAAVAAALLTPHGIAGLLQPIRLIGMPALRSGFIEWMPANFSEFPALEIWLLGGLALALAGGVHVPLPRLALLLGLVHMALAHVRHADLLGLVAPLAIAGSLGPRLAELTRPSLSSPVFRAAAALARPARLPAIALVLALAVAASLPVLARPPARSGDAVTPEAALAAAARKGLTGPVFNSEAFGGYLAFSGVPVFIDGRIEMYGNDFLAAYLTAERGDETELDRLLERYNVTWTLLQAESPAAAALDRNRRWQRSYADDRAVIHVRLH
jgi:hypothetical protein